MKGLLILTLLLCLTKGKANNNWDDMPSEKLVDIAMSHYLQQQGQTDSALLCLNHVIARADNQPSTLLRAYYAKWHISLLCLGDFVRSNECLWQAQKLTRQLGTDEARLHLYLGYTYMMLTSQSDNNAYRLKAYQYLMTACEQSRKHKHNDIYINAFTNLVDVAAQLQLLNEIQDLWRHYQKLNQTQSFEYHYGYLAYLASCAIQQGDNQRAQQLLQQQLNTLPDTIAVAQSYYITTLLNIAKITTHTERSQLLQQILELTDDQQFIDMRLEALHIKLNDARQYGDHKLQNQCLQHYVALKDSVINKRRLSNIGEAQLLTSHHPSPFTTHHSPPSSHRPVYCDVIAAILLILPPLLLVLLLLRRRTLAQLRRTKLLNQEQI